jgi:predicted transglutaminase-like cysteine proteinase
MRMALFLLIIVLTVGVAVSAAKAVTAQRQEPVTHLKPWPDFYQRQTNSLQALSSCEKGVCESPEIKRWADLIGRLKDQNRLRQIITVNLWFNRLPYKYDEYAYNQIDYWADTRQLLKKRGDCEDFALSKYYTLRQLGFRPDEMRIMVVYDKLTYTNHAVLMIYINDTRYMLDINSDETDPSPMEYRYSLIYGFNEKTAWYY